MIQINLLPGNARRAKRRMPRLALPSIRKSDGIGGGGSSIDRWMVIVVAAWLLGPGLTGWLFVGARSKTADLNVAIEGARLDSIRYAEMRQANDIMRARQDTIAQKMQIIQTIDGARYTWAHIVDEVSRSLPQYTWLVDIAYVTNTTELEAPSFVIGGRTGNTFALVQFMQQLEASPFIKKVTLQQTDQVREQDKDLYRFTLQGEYELPTADLIQTVPLFTRGED